MGAHTSGHAFEAYRTLTPPTTTCTRPADTVPIARVMTTSGAAPAAQRTNAVRVFAGRFETERTYVMVKPDGVQRGLVRPVSLPLSIHQHGDGCLHAAYDLHRIHDLLMREDSARA